MIASTGFAAVFLLAVIAKDSTADPSSVKKVLTKPVHHSPPAEMQNFVPVSPKSIPYWLAMLESVDRILTDFFFFFSEINRVRLLQQHEFRKRGPVQKSNRTELGEIPEIRQFRFRALRKHRSKCTYRV